MALNISFFEIEKSDDYLINQYTLLPCLEVDFEKMLPYRLQQVTLSDTSKTFEYYKTYRGDFYGTTSYHPYEFFFYDYCVVPSERCSKVIDGREHQLIFDPEPIKCTVDAIAMNLSTFPASEQEAEAFSRLKRLVDSAFNNGNYIEHAYIE